MRLEPTKRRDTFEVNDDLMKTNKVEISNTIFLLLRIGLVFIYSKQKNEVETKFLWQINVDK